MKFIAAILGLYILTLTAQPAVEEVHAAPKMACCEKSCCAKMGHEQKQTSGTCNQNKKCCNGTCNSCMFCCFLVGSYVKPQAYIFTPLVAAKQAFSVSTEKFLANYNSDTWRPPEMV